VDVALEKAKRQKKKKKKGGGKKKKKRKWMPETPFELCIKPSLQLGLYVNFPLILANK